MTSRRFNSFVYYYYYYYWIEGSQSSFRARKSSEMRSRTTRLEPQHEDNEDSDYNPHVADRQDDEDQDEEDEEGDGYPFPRYRRRSGEFHFQTHTPKYYGRSHTPPRGVLPTQPPRLQSTGQIRTQSSMEVLRGHSHSHSQPQPQPCTDSRQQFYSQHSDLDSYPDPYPRPHARPHVQDRGRDIYSSRSSHSSSLPSRSSSPSRSQIEPSPIQRDYVLIQPQTQLSVPVLKRMRSQTQLQQSQSQPQLQLQTQAQTSHSVPYLSTQNQGLPIHSSTTTTTSALPLIPISISAAPSVSLPASSSSAMSIPPSSVPVSVPTSSLSNKHGNPPPLSPPSFSASSALLSKKIVRALKPDKLGDPVKRASWEYVDLEEDDDELVSVSVSEESSSVGGLVGVGVVSGDSGLGVGSGTSFGLGHPFPIAQQLQSTKQLQPVTKYPSMNQQQCRQLEHQYQQSDVQTRPHVEPDSDESEDEGGTTTAGGDASVLVFEPITTAPAAPSITLPTTMIIDSQPPSLNSIPHSIPCPILPSIPNSSSSPNPEYSSPNLKFDARTNNHPKRTHTQSRSHFSNYSQSGFHSDSHMARMEDMTESELDFDFDDDLDHDRDVGFSTVQRVGGTDGNALLPSLGYLDEALTFIAEERARWSAAREGGAVGAVGSGSGAGAGGSTGAAPEFAIGGGKKMENRKVLGRFPFSFLQYISWVIFCWLCGVGVSV